MASHSNPLKRSASIKRYYGFKETTYRFLFPYEDHFKVAPKLSVILPTGVVENEKTLVPKPGKGVIAYVYEQTVNPDLVEEYLETPFVREATEDGSRRTLVQAWPTNFNDTFKKDYKIYTKNPNPLVFKETVKRSFQTAMCELFEFAPDDSSAPKVLYCHKASVNDSDVLVGTTKQLIDHLKGNAQDRIDMGIVSLSADGFVTQMVDKNGVKTGTKPFTMTPGEKYALYMKKADITMACATLFEQFMDGRELFKEIALDKEEDDASTEPYETDEDTDEDNEIGDGLSSDRETNESLLASAPNLLGNFTRAVSELKDREAKTAAMSPTSLTRSLGNADFFDEGNEDELREFATSKDVLLDLPTVVFQSKETDAKLERADAFIKCKATGDETDVCDGALTDGEPSEELLAAAPNLLDKLTCTWSDCEEKEAKMAAISPTAVRSMGAVKSTDVPFMQMPMYNEFEKRNEKKQSALPKRPYAGNFWGDMEDNYSRQRKKALSEGPPFPERYSMEAAAEYYDSVVEQQ